MAEGYPITFTEMLRQYEYPVASRVEEKQRQFETLYHLTLVDLLNHLSVGEEHLHRQITWTVGRAA